MGPLIASISFALATTSIAAQLTTVVTTATPSLSTNVPPCAIVSAAQAAGLYNSLITRNKAECSQAPHLSQHK